MQPLHRSQATLQHASAGVSGSDRVCQDELVSLAVLDESIEIRNASLYADAIQGGLHGIDHLVAMRRDGFHCSLDITAGVVGVLLDRREHRCEVVRGREGVEFMHGSGNLSHQ